MSAGKMNVLAALDAAVDAAQAEIRAAGADASQRGMLNTPRQQEARTAHGRALKARAAVAELIAAAKEVTLANGSAYLPSVASLDRLAAALARVGGAA